MLDISPDRVALIYTLCLLVGLWFGWLKLLRPRVRRWFSRWTAVGDALLGREAIKDSITGEERVPALPGIGQRMATVEDAVKTLAEAVAAQAAINQRVDRVEAQVLTNTENIAAIMTATAERIVTKAEAAAMWHAVANSDLDPGDDDKSDPSELPDE